MEPQAQIIWQQVVFNQANDGLGPVGLGTTSGTTGRLGLRGMWTIDGYNGQVWQPYVRTNIWRDWGAEATTTFGIDQVPLIEEATAANPPISPGRKQVRILYGAQIGVAPPSFVFFTNVATTFHFSYERFLLNQLREKFGFVGTPIRIQVRRRAKRGR